VAYNRTFDIGTLTFDSLSRQRVLPEIDPRRSSEIWVVGSIEWTGQPEPFTARLLSTLDGLVMPSPLIQSDHGNPYRLSLRGDMRAVTDVILSVGDLPVDEVLTMDLVAILSYT